MVHVVLDPCDRVVTACMFCCIETHGSLFCVKFECSNWQALCVITNIFFPPFTVPGVCAARVGSVLVLTASGVANSVWKCF